MSPPWLKTEAIHRFGDYMKSRRRRSFLSPPFPGHGAVCAFLQPPLLPLWRKQTHKLLLCPELGSQAPGAGWLFTSTINTRLTVSGSGSMKHDVVSRRKCLGQQQESQSPGAQPGEVPPLAGCRLRSRPLARFKPLPALARLHFLLASLSLCPLICGDPNSTNFQRGGG